MGSTKQELAWLAASFAAFIAIIYITYHKENTATVARTAAAIYWLFVIPGWAVMNHWRENLGFVERLAVGTAGAMAITGVASYYLGLVGLKLQNQALILPAAVIIASFGANLFAEKSLSKMQK